MRPSLNTLSQHIKYLKSEKNKQSWRFGRITCSTCTRALLSLVLLDGVSVKCRVTVVGLESRDWRGHLALCTVLPWNQLWPPRAEASLFSLVTCPLPFEAVLHSRNSLSVYNFITFVTSATARKVSVFWTLRLTVLSNIIWNVTRRIIIKVVLEES